MTSAEKIKQINQEIKQVNDFCESISQSSTKNGQIMLVPRTKHHMYLLSLLMIPGDNIKAKFIRKNKNVDAKGRMNQQSETIEGIVIIDSVLLSDDSDGIILSCHFSPNYGDRSLAGSTQKVHVCFDYSYTIYKNYWDEFSIDILRKYYEPESSPICIILMQMNQACIYGISESAAFILGTAKASIPKVRTTTYDKRNDKVKKFFSDILDVLKSKVDINAIRALVIASPGFIAKQLSDFLQEKYSGLPKELVKNILITHCSSTGPHEISKILESDSISSFIKDGALSLQVSVYHEILKTANKDISRLVGGVDNVLKIAKENISCIDKIVVLDSVLFGMSLKNKKELEDLKSLVEIKIFSKNQAGGNEIDSLGGMIALLKYGMAMDDDNIE